MAAHSRPPSTRHIVNVRLQRRRLHAKAHSPATYAALIYSKCWRVKLRPSGLPRAWSRPTSRCPYLDVHTRFLSLTDIMCAAPEL
ncbi:hypothetical protein A0H81_12726 [Grifola frondosa]|uniref:Uncharacterized protein n=1 Tax=Grifola frondosa TaxID=5627 RepID=A0A1C7LTW0_GRIFR|nr:hypothetical protein A0H81_12726 [Grifola frondosa]